MHFPGPPRIDFMVQLKDLAIARKLPSIQALFEFGTIYFLRPFEYTELKIRETRVPALFKVRKY
jgi:hypothetical protein